MRVPPLHGDDEIGSICKRRLCFKCVGEVFLRAEIEQTGETGNCFYCEKDGKTASIEEMADRIEGAFERHFHRTPMDEDGHWNRKGDPVTYVIGYAAEIEEEPAEDIRQVLEERHADWERSKMGDEGPFDIEAHYVEVGPNDIEFKLEWAEFERSLKTEARFFSKIAEATLAIVFEGLAGHKTDTERPIIVEAGPGTETQLYRARVFQSNNTLKEALKRPDLEIGPPPSPAATAGRMNAHGISVFYGATNWDVALAEVQPPVGSRVMIGRFDFLRVVRLLDVEALQSVYVDGSIFDVNYIRRLELAKFLDALSQRITMPVMPKDEPVEYLVTQAIADYLATQANLDGIIYPSVQFEGDNEKNIALFHHASRVEEMDLPKAVELNAHLDYPTDEGPEVYYVVWEEVPPSSPIAPEDQGNALLHLGAFPEIDESHDYDLRKTTLRLDTKSIHVRHVTGVSFKTTRYSVQRHRFEKRKPNF